MCISTGDTTSVDSRTIQIKSELLASESDGTISFSAGSFNSFSSGAVFISSGSMSAGSRKNKSSILINGGHSDASVGGLLSLSTYSSNVKNGGALSFQSGK